LQAVVTTFVYVRRVTAESGKTILIGKLMIAAVQVTLLADREVTVAAERVRTLFIRRSSGVYVFVPMRLGYQNKRVKELIPPYFTQAQFWLTVDLLFIL
jgi:hypothetical protein